MSINDRPTFETLSAFVDGELDDAGHDWVRWWIDHDQAVAREVSALQALKARVANLQMSDPIGSAPLSARKQWSPALTLVAASLALGLVVLGGYRTILGKDPVPEQIVAAYDSWGPATASPVLTSSKDIALFQRAGLIFQGEETLRVANQNVTHSTYLGSGGCRVSLFEFPLEAVDPQPIAEVLRSDKGALATAWTSRRATYVMVARRMNQTRFDAIATALQDIDRKEQDLIVAQVNIPRSACVG